MRKTSAIELSELIIECPTCAATGWVQAVADAPDLVIECRSVMGIPGSRWSPDEHGRRY